MAHFARDVLRTSLTQGVMIGSGLVAGILTARVLGTDGRGLFSLGLSIADTAILFGGLELGTALVYARGRGREPDASIVGAGLIAPLLLGGLSAAVLLLMWPLISGYLSLLPHDLFVLAVVLIPVSMSGAAVRQVFRALDDFSRFNTLRVLISVTRVTFIAVAFVFGGGVREALIAVLASSGSVFIVGVVMLLRRTRPDLKSGLRLVPRLLRFGVKLQSAAVFGYASARISVFAIAAYLDADAIAFFAIADGLIQQLSGLPMVIASVLLPKISGIAERSRIDLTASTHRFVFFALILLALVVWGVSHWLVIGLYGESYAPAVAILAVLLPCMVCQAGSRVLQPYLIAKNRIVRLIGIQGVAFALHVILLFLWIPTHGIIGAAWAVTVVAGIRWILFIVSVSMIAEVPIYRILVLSGDDTRRILQTAREQLGLIKA